MTEVGFHTAGPWYWGEHRSGLFGADDEPVLRWEPYEGMWLSILNNREDENAALIAAAPELLSALEALAALYDSDEGCKTLHEYIAAQSAISKAKGAV